MRDLGEPCARLPAAAPKLYWQDPKLVGCMLHNILAYLNVAPAWH